MTQQWGPPASVPARTVKGPVDPGGPLHTHRVALRRQLRHRLELLCLAIAIGISLIAALIVLVELTLAIVDGRSPATFAIFLLLAPLIVWFGRGSLFAQQRLRAVRITPTQYPEAWAMLVDGAQRFGLEEVPDAYVVSGNGAINAFASGHGFRRYVVVYSDLFEVGGAARQPETLRFIIGHELGHIAAGHTSYWRMLLTFAASYVPFVYPALSRSQEYTSDSYGYHLCPEGAMSSIATLGAGKYLNATVDTDQLIDRVSEERGFFVWLANALASHPVLLWRGQALRDRSRPGRLLWRPRPELGPRPRPSPHVGHLPPNPVLGQGRHPSQVRSTWALPAAPYPSTGTDPAAAPPAPPPPPGLP